MVALIARHSKYDFWILDGILILEIKIQKKIFFLDVNFFGSKNIFGDFFWTIFFFLTQNRNFRFWVRKKKWVQKSRRFFFSINIFDLEKYVFDLIFFSRVKISSGIQKSYLERRAMSATMLKMQFLEAVS